MEPRRPRRLRATAWLLLVVLVASPGCRLATWGVPEGEPDFSVEREAWELPVGSLLLPVAFGVEVTVSLALALTLAILNPINWAALAATGDLILYPEIWILPGTATATTLINPHWNLNWGRPVPPDTFSFGVRIDPHPHPHPH